MPPDKQDIAFATLTRFYISVAFGFCEQAYAKNETAAPAAVFKNRDPSRLMPFILLKKPMLMFQLP